MTFYLSFVTLCLKVNGTETLSRLSLSRSNKYVKLLVDEFIYFFVKFFRTKWLLLTSVEQTTIGEFSGYD